MSDIIHRCPICHQNNVVWDGVSFIWLCLTPTCLWSGDDEDLLQDGDYLSKRDRAYISNYWPVHKPGDDLGCDS